MGCFIYSVQALIQRTINLTAKWRFSYGSVRNYQSTGPRYEHCHHSEHMEAQIGQLFHPVPCVHITSTLGWLDLVCVKVTF